jgi:DNA polymerase bacteriophage-type
VYHGCAPGRWTGRGAQPQNLPKADKNVDADTAIAGIKAGELVPLATAVSVMRGLVCAKPGHVLIGADFSSIESRVLAWLSGERWKLDIYRQFDETGDPEFEPYCITASKILGRKVTPADEEGRGIGKVADLFLGFGGSIGAWRKGAPNDKRSDDEIKADGDKWRKAHPKITKFWNALDVALKRAILRPGKVFHAGRVCADFSGEALWVTLPSGRTIAYPEAHLVEGKYEDTVDIALKDNEHGKWKDVTAWYGVFIENVVQGTARDLLAAALIRLEAAGFPIVAHIHDEVIAEVPAGTDRTAEFAAIMTLAPVHARTWVNP